MRKFYVYVHTCTANGKKYVGVTSRDPESRWLKGRGYYQNKHFYSAILKYGWDNIEHEVFEVESEEEMYRKEVELISFYHSNDPKFGYNNSVGGEYSHLGCKHSKESKKKMSEALKKSHSGLEYKKKMSETVKKRNSDPEYLEKISEAAKKRWSDPGVRKKQSEVAKNRPRIKISLPDGTVLEMTKQNLTRNYINKGKKFEYVS